jgi:prophage antirepressor-like protein
MNELQIFNYEGKDIRTVVLENGEPGFISKDTCDVLEIDSTQTRRLDDDEKVLCLIQTPGGKQEMQVVTESGLYSLVLGSRKPEAKQFKRWVTHEVLPTIRKTGTYSVQPMSQLEILAQAAQALLEQDKAIKQLTFTQNKQAEEIQGMRDVISLDTTSWRYDTKTLINKMATKQGGPEHIQDLRRESYELLDKRMGVSVQTRLTNKRRRMADEGVCRSARDKLNVLDVVAEDKKLIEGYTAIIKEMAIKYNA